MRREELTAHNEKRVAQRIGKPPSEANLPAIKKQQRNRGGFSASNFEVNGKVYELNSH